MKKIIKAATSNADLTELNSVVDDIEFLVNYDNFDGNTLDEFYQLYESLIDKMQQFNRLLSKYN